MAFQLADLDPLDLSAALPAATDAALGPHLHKPGHQEDLAFGYWRPSQGATRLTAVIREIVWPEPDDRELSGNVAFRGRYLERVLAARPIDSGIVFLHGHLGPGWQDMSADDIVAERDRLADVVAGATDLPLLGMTRGTDGAWSARFWARAGTRAYRRLDARSVRVVGRHLRLTFHPDDRPPEPTAALGETASVWGTAAQDDLARVRMGIVGLGSVGSMGAEGASRMGMSRLTYIDHDRIERRNLDRTIGATEADVVAGLAKVQIAARATARSHTTSRLDLRVVEASLLDERGYAAVLDCDLVLSCVDRPLPRSVLNALAYAHLIPVVDAGISAAVRPDGRPLHVAWRIAAAAPDRGCLYCSGTLRRSDVALDLVGLLDDPDYLRGLSAQDRAIVARRNVYPFSMSASAHQLLQAIGIITSLETIGGTGVQLYNGFPGSMEVTDPTCEPGCEIAELTARPMDLLRGVATTGE